MNQKKSLVYYSAIACAWPEERTPFPLIYEGKELCTKVSEKQEAENIFQNFAKENGLIKHFNITEDNIHAVKLPGEFNPKNYFLIPETPTAKASSANVEQH